MISSSFTFIIKSAFRRFKSSNQTIFNCISKFQFSKNKLGSTQNLMQVYKETQDMEKINTLLDLPLIKFSTEVHHLSKNKTINRNSTMWAMIEHEFMNRIEITRDPVKIRSYSKVLYSLSKNNSQPNLNYETKMSLLLPFASKQSFTEIVSSISRIGPFSQEFAYIVESLYIKRRAIFNTREKITINYSLTRNGKKVDKDLIKEIDRMNCVETITMLRCYDNCQQMNAIVLQTSEKKLLAIKDEINILDLTDIITIYFKYNAITPQMENLLEYNYNILKKHVNEHSIEKIWEFMPQVINSGKLKVRFVEDIIKTLIILRSQSRIKDQIFFSIKKTFQTIDNLQIRSKLELIK